MVFFRNEGRNSPQTIPGDSPMDQLSSQGAQGIVDVGGKKTIEKLPTDIIDTSGAGSGDSNSTRDAAGTAQTS